MTKPYFLLLCLSIVCYTTNYAQIIYTKQDSLSNNFYGICEEIGSANLLVTSTKQKIAPNGDFYLKTQLLKINNAGVLLDSMLIDTNFVTYGPALVSGNYYYIYGVKYIGSNLNSVTVMPTLIKYDVNFNVVAKTHFNSYNSNVISAVQTTVAKNNRIYIGFGTNYNSVPKSLYYKLDSQLNKLDSAKLNGDGLLSMINYGSNIMVCGYGFDYPSSLGRLQIHELDTTFNLVSHFNMDSLTYITVVGGGSFPSCSSQIGIGSWRGNLLEISNNAYLISGYYGVLYNSSCHQDDQNIVSVIKNNNQVVKTNILGKQNGIHEASNYFANTAKKYNHLYTVSKSGANLQNPFSPQNILTEIMVSKLDTNGNVIWNNFYNTPDYYYDPYSIAATSDSGVVVCGVRYNIVNPAITGVCEGFVMKIDKNGNQVFAGINDKEINASNAFNLFPNPAINETTIQINNVEKPYEASITIIDMLGKIVYQTSKTIDIGSNSIMLDTKLFANGLYHITVISNDKSITRKLSIAK